MIIKISYKREVIHAWYLVEKPASNMMVWTKSICLLIVINSCAFSIPLGKGQRQGKFLSIFSLVSFEVREGRITI